MATLSHASFFALPLIVLIGFIGFVVTEIASWDADTSSGWFFLWILGMIALPVRGSLFAIFACVKTGKGEWYRYPVTVRFVPGAVSGDRAAVK